MATVAAAAAAPYERVMEDMAKGREYATQLQALLRESPEAGRLLDRILHAMSRTIDTAKTAAADAAAAAAEEAEASEVQSDVTCAGTAAGAKRKAAAGGGDKRPACRKRTNNQSSVVTKNSKDLEDGHAWRKYGQKEIQNCKYPKAYFRCTHKFDQQCVAQRQVQRRDDDPDTYTVTYIGVHTCRDPATAVATLVVHAAAGGEELHAGSRLISFAATGGNASAAATTSTTTTGNTNQQLMPAVLLQPLKVEVGVGGEQEEVLSSLTPPGSSPAMRNNAAAATPGLDQGDVTSGLQLQHCYGDDELAVADMADFGYDDTFWTTLCSESITDMLSTEL